MDEPRESSTTIVTRNIEAMLLLTGKKQKDLAKAMRVNQGTVSRKLTGVTKWDLNDLDLAARYFGVTVADIVRDGCLPAAHMILDNTESD